MEQQVTKGQLYQILAAGGTYLRQGEVYVAESVSRKYVHFIHETTGAGPSVSRWQLDSQRAGRAFVKVVEVHP